MSFFKFILKFLIFLDAIINGIFDYNFLLFVVSI